MPLDKRLTRAIVESVKFAGEDQLLSKRLVALFESLGSGQVSVDDKESMDRHIELVYSQVSDKPIDSE